MSKRRPIPSSYSPKVWPTWCAVGIAWLIARLPLPAFFALANALGRLAHRLAAERRRIARTNLTLCFPDWPEARRRAVVEATFRHTALGALEAMLPWLNPKRDLGTRIDLVGTEHLRAAESAGRGVLLVSAHFTTLDVVSAALSTLGTIDVMYRYNKNPVWEWLQVSGRKRYFDGVIERKNTRAALRSLKAGRCLWYAADQDYGAKHSVFAPFFGVPAASITATSRFAKLNRSPVVFMINTRDEATRRWRVEFFEALDAFPSGNDVQDATRINQLIEQEIRRRPEQYLWIHKRFKTRPSGEPSLYDG